MIGRLSGLTGAQTRQRTQELLRQFELDDAARRKVATYSGGMRRRLDLAVSLVRRPAVIFLDEPTTGLDPRSRQTMWQIITDLVKSGVTVFLTTQYLEEADQLADRIAVIDHGRVVAEGTAAELKEQVAEQRLDLTIADARAYAVVARFLGRRAILSDASRLMLGVATDGSAADIRRLLDEVDPQSRNVQHFEVHSATLDDVFLALTGQTNPTKELETANV
jgi:ABC-2 type transport system ATP-binding protein